MRSSTRKRLIVVIAALAAAVLAAIIFSGGYSAGVGVSFSRQQDAEVARQDSTSASDTTNTIGEASVAASTAPISQDPCD